MLTPRGFDPARLGGSHRRRRGRARGALVAVLVLALLAGVGYAGWWAYDRWQDDPEAGQAGSTGPVAASSCSPSQGPVPSPSAGSATASVPVPARQITVNVFNATTKAGLAAAVSTQLEARGFRIGTVGNDPAGRPVKGTAQVRSGATGAAAARTLAAHVAGAQLASDKRPGATVDLVIGNAYSRLRPAAAAAAVLAPPSPSPSPSC
ncbi:LytR C-terminal domain-containing protein [Motilibacter deserti]|nr:LytR C-terminal domain-containing protein [Motilibacter deserti]